MVSGRRFAKDIRSGWNWKAMICRSSQAIASGKPSADQAVTRRPERYHRRRIEKKKMQTLKREHYMTDDRGCGNEHGILEAV